MNRAFSKIQRTSGWGFIALVAVILLIAYYLMHYIWHAASIACPYKFNGGSPNIDGSCWCGWDRYCLCTPSLAIDCIIEYSLEGEDYLVIVERGQSPPGYAVVGGFVEVGESAEDATKREVKEETGLDVQHLSQFHFYSDPHRDPRRHTASLVFIAQAIGTLHAGDDAKRAVKLKMSEVKTELNNLNFAFDHKKILTDYLYARNNRKEAHTKNNILWNEMRSE
mmetsp:Transcript_31471/g.40460  ORF Transcript_31471/g.40460 Transcript_31471/m.40460 type:complete len:223 (-) Transcript_31471:54-722(-)